MICNICPHRCGVERRTGRGFCGCGEEILVSRVQLHQWEEPCIGAKAGAIFFGGCTLRCVFCQNHLISRKAVGTTYTPAQLSELFRELEAQGAACIDLVSPTQYTVFIAQALQIYKPSIPVVWNSGGYELAHSLRMLDGLVDVYLPDLKYYDADVGIKYSNAPDYFVYASCAVKEMIRQTGEAQFSADGQMLRGTLIRHLVLPGNLRQSFRILEWIAREAPSAHISLMSQYFPAAQANLFPELSRRVKRSEYMRVVAYARRLGLTNGYTQQMSAADSGYVPDFSRYGSKE